jgi:hypothetical protein
VKARNATGIVATHSRFSRQTEPMLTETEAFALLEQHCGPLRKPSQSHWAGLHYDRRAGWTVHGCSYIGMVAISPRSWSLPLAISLHSTGGFIDEYDTKRLRQLSADGTPCERTLRLRYGGDANSDNYHVSLRAIYALGRRRDPCAGRGCIMSRHAPQTTMSWSQWVRVTEKKSWTWSQKWLMTAASLWAWSMRAMDLCGPRPRLQLRGWSPMIPKPKTESSA